MRYVAIKTVEQQDIQAVHRVRASVVGQRTAQANQIRGLVSEYGLVAPKQLSSLRKAVPDWLEDAENELTPRFRALLHSLWVELKRLDQRIGELDREIEQLSEEHPDAKRLKQLQGVGPLIATALVARLGDASQYLSYRLDRNRVAEIQEQLAARRAI